MAERNNCTRVRCLPGLDTVVLRRAPGRNWKVALRKMRKMTRRRFALLFVFMLLALFLVPYNVAGNTSPVYMNGIDVSHYQNDATINATGQDINWTRVHQEGKIEFAFVKATDGQPGNMPEVNYDSSYRSNTENGHNAGLRMGAYHYAEPVLHMNDSNDAVAEANWFLDQAYPVGKDYLSYGLPPALDLENDFCLGLISNHWTPKNVTDWVLTWMHVVEARTHVAPVLYTSEVCFTTTYFDPFEAPYDKRVTQYGVWVARYDSVEVQHPPSAINDPYENWNPDWGTRITDNMWGHWGYWQYSSRGIIAGISGNVDLDYVSQASWNQPSPGPTPSPSPASSSTSIGTLVGLAIAGAVATVVGGLGLSYARSLQPRRRP